MQDGRSLIDGGGRGKQKTESRNRGSRAMSGVSGMDGPDGTAVATVVPKLETMLVPLS